AETTIVETATAPSACASAACRSLPWSARNIDSAISTRYSHTPTFQPTSQRVTRLVYGAATPAATPTANAISIRGRARKWLAMGAKDNRRMHPNALLELATDLLHKVMRFDA